MRNYVLNYREIILANRWMSEVWRILYLVCMFFNVKLKKKCFKVLWLFKILLYQVQSKRTRRIVFLYHLFNQFLRIFSFLKPYFRLWQFQSQVKYQLPRSCNNLGKILSLGWYQWKSKSCRRTTYYKSHSKLYFFLWNHNLPHISSVSLPVWKFEF